MEGGDLAMEGRDLRLVVEGSQMGEAFPMVGAFRMVEAFQTMEGEEEMRGGNGRAMEMGDPIEISSG
jgi:hypothetical protein